MNRWLGGVSLALCGALALWAADDTDAAKKTRDEGLKVKVTVDWKDLQLGDCLKELAAKIDEAGKGKVEFKYATGVSMNTRMKYSAKDKAVEDVLDELFKTDYGYIVISRKGDKTDGGLLITKGAERGTAMVAKPGDKPGKDKPAKDKDKTAKDKPEPKAKPEPKTKPEPKDTPKDPPSADDKEKTAAQKLDLIKMLLDSGKKEKAKERLEELIKAFPDTKAVTEAKEMLEKLK